MLPTYRFLTARLVRPGSSRAMAAHNKRHMAGGGGCQGGMGIHGAGCSISLRVVWLFKPDSVLHTQGAPGVQWQRLVLQWVVAPCRGAQCCCCCRLPCELAEALQPPRRQEVKTSWGHSLFQLLAYSLCACKQMQRVMKGQQLLHLLLQDGACGSTPE
jgi:hypothetical protein